MSLKELFPRYPLELVSPRGSMIRFGTRKLYVDFPWQAYYFMASMMGYSAEANLSAEEVREAWKGFSQNNDLTFSNKPLASVYLWDAPFTQKKSLVLRIGWELFLEYLEEKAQNFVLEVENDARNITKVYREIWENFFGVAGELNVPISFYFREREKFRKLLKRTGDYFYLKVLLARFEEIMKRMEKHLMDTPSAQLYTMNIRMNIQHLHALIDVVSIPAAYLLLRNILENFAKLLIYRRIGESLNEPDIILSAMFLYEYEADREQRIYTFKKFKKEFEKKFLRIQNTFSTDEALDISEVVKKFKEKGFPVLGMNANVLKEFSTNHDLNASSKGKLYSACSEIIHNQPPLPFFSLLEVKFFKHFLEKYLDSLQLEVESLIGERIEKEEVYPFQFLGDRKSLNKCLQTAYLLETNYDEVIKEQIKNAIIVLQNEQSEMTESSSIWIKLLTLISLFNLISPSLRRLRDFSFIEEDIVDIVEKLQPLSFKIGIQNEIEETLRELQDMMLPELERYSIFSSLSSEQKRKVIFYLLIYYLPKILEETLRS